MDKDTVCKWVYQSGVTNQGGTIYIDNIDYQTTNGASAVIIRIHNPEGYATKFGQYYYNRYDHLGNVREVWLAGTSLSSAYQRTQYYPSGLPWAAYTGDNPGYLPFKYNGKEFVEMHGWDCTDLGWRWDYNATFRFTSLDRKSEKYPWQSPYCVASDNPVRYNDKNGENTTDPKPAQDDDKKKTTAIDKTAAKLHEKIIPQKMTDQQVMNTTIKQAQAQPRGTIISQAKADALKSLNSLSSFDQQANQSVVTKAVGTGMIVTGAAIAAPEMASVATEIITSQTTIKAAIDIYNVSNKIAPLLPVGEGILKGILNAPPDTPYLINNDKYITTVDFFNSLTTIYKDNVNTK
jgi:hypothetical protein